MADQRDGGIAWTDETWNVLRGCSKVSAGCANCYAEGMAARFSGPGMPFEGLIDGRHWNGAVKLVENRLTAPLRWRRPRRVFVTSVSDPFHQSVTDEMLDRLFAIMALCPQHTFQLLTKRPERMREYLAGCEARVAGWTVTYAANTGPNGDTPRSHPPLRMGPWTGNTVMDAPHPIGFETWPLPNVWLGVSVENQDAADERIPHLLATPAAVRFISAEPLLGPVDLERWLTIVWQCRGCRGYFTGRHREICPDCGREVFWSGSHAFNGRGRNPNKVFPPQSGRGIDWVIVGGESGPKARPMHPDWARGLRDQCAAAGVPFFFKQWGEWLCSDSVDQPTYRGKHQYIGNHQHAFRIGKKAAGRMLDGVEHNAFPATA